MGLDWLQRFRDFLNLFFQLSDSLFELGEIILIALGKQGQARGDCRNGNSGDDPVAVVDWLMRLTAIQNRFRSTCDAGERKGERWLALQQLSNCQARGGPAIRSTVWFGDFFIS